MPKKIEPEEEYEEEEDDEEEEDEEGEEYEEAPAPAPVKGKGRGKVASSLPPLPPPRLRASARGGRTPAPAVPERRYSSFAQQATEGIMDSETQEVIATDMWTALANIIERLERIEDAIGVMQQ